MTHALQYLADTDLVIVMEEDGSGACRIAQMGPFSELVAVEGSPLCALMREHDAGRHSSAASAAASDDSGSEAGETARRPTLTRAISQDPERTRTSSSAGKDGSKRPGAKLGNDETVELGRVSRAVYKTYIKAVGYWAVGSLALFYVLAYGISVGSNVWLSYWSEQTVKDEKKVQDHIGMYLGVYAGLGLGNALLVLCATLTLIFSALRASQKLHNAMLRRILRAPMAFFDLTPLGRILNRFSKDIFVMDTTIPMSLRSFLSTFFNVLSILLVISVSTPFFLVAILPLTWLYYRFQQYYVGTSRQLKRLESVSRSPIYAHFSETLHGVTTIRAYGEQERFTVANAAKVDYNMEAYYPSICANRWLALRLEFLGNCVVFFAALLAVIDRESISAGIAGLSISYAMNITQTLNWMVRMSSQLETDIVAVERVVEYSRVAEEAPAIVHGNRPALGWPTHGEIQLSNYSVRYREGLDLVLRGITVHIHPREKIGIVGRTGAGKSSLTLALFRIIEPALGSIVIDGIDIATLGLEDLRSRITVMP